ncbi:MAG: hypothetical protein AUJ48_02735 [Deltaproteobacteria bacterium CG1_02_45_11]|nr:MAG: hypothetical protein AUJ48_02735 [Deltaproteobacteria bacterium CG1_02_45_11]
MSGVNILQPKTHNGDYVIFQIFTNFTVISATDHICLSPADMRIMYKQVSPVDLNSDHLQINVINSQNILTESLGFDIDRPTGWFVVMSGLYQKETAGYLGYKDYRTSLERRSCTNPFSPKGILGA